MERHAHAPSYLREVFLASLRVRSMTIFSMSSMRFFIETSFFVYLPLFALNNLDIAVNRGGLLFTVFAIGSIVTAGMAGSITRRFERVPLVIAAFFLQGLCLLAASVAGSVWVLGVAMLAFGLANGVISPAQKSLLTQSVPGQLRGGFVAADRIAQNTAKSIAPVVAGAVVVFASIETMFQAMGAFAIGWALVVAGLELRGMLRPADVQAAIPATDL